MFTFSIVILSLFVTFSNTLNVSPYSTYQFHRETNRNTLLQIPSQHFPFVDLLPNQINSRAILNGRHIILKLKPKTARHVQKYLFLLLLANASDTETNPGPKHLDCHVGYVIRLSHGNTKLFVVTHVKHGFTQTAKAYQITYI